MNDKKYDKKIVLHITEFQSVSERSLYIVNVNIIPAMQFLTGISRNTQCVYGISGLMHGGTLINLLLYLLVFILHTLQDDQIHES